MDIQYISLMIGKGVDMSNKNQNDILLSALEIVIDGVANSEATERTRAAGAYIAGLISAKARLRTRLIVPPGSPAPWRMPAGPRNTSIRSSSAGSNTPALSQALPAL